MMNGRIDFDHDAGGGHVLLQIRASCMEFRAFLVPRPVGVFGVCRLKTFPAYETLRASPKAEKYVVVVGSQMW